MIMEMNFEGQVSPRLREGIKNYLIDIDGTITDDVPNEQPERMIHSKPYPDARDTINHWFEQGHKICSSPQERRILERLPRNGWTVTVSNTTASCLVNRVAEIITGLTIIRYGLPNI